jgi:UDP-N-acetylglucosamine diphosphorylase / glucose-1-phosphate thymidylyltransferase / UDP-N-acetylgalactosamine diphosphorylase / glucosamine-1-phosphate N-acetyltransferase / galactosamine-1-phosphate N-acetyltransferase
MQVVLLAAGLGSRLGPAAGGLPKALVSVAGRPLLGHAVDFAARLEPQEIVVVGGFQFAGVADAVARLGLPVRLVENIRFRGGNLLSLLAARSEVRGEFLLMNVDHIYRPALAPIIAAPVDEVTAYVDTDRPLGDDDMKVARDGDGCVAEISKTLGRHDCGYVGITRVPGPRLPAYWRAVEAVQGSAGESANVEQVLQWMAAHDAPPRCRDVSGHGWLEVDRWEEREHAEQALRAGWS